MNAQDLKNSILQLAVQGKLVEQRAEEGTARELLEQIKLEKDQLIKDKKIKKSKPLPEITEDEIPFEIPENWKWVRLIDICKLISDGTHKTPTYVDIGVPFVSVKDVSGGKLDLSDVKYISEDEHKKLTERCMPQKNDVLICRIGTLGKAIRIDTDIEFSIFVSLGLIKLINVSLADYIVTVINSGYGYKWIEDNKVGGGTHTNKINLETLRGMPIPIPPIAEQYRIVAKIEEILPYIEQYDKAYTKLETFNKKFSEDMKKSILQLAMQGKLVEQRPEEGTADELYKQIVAEKAELIKEGKIKKEKPLPEITEDEIPFEIPASWKWVRFGEFGSYKKGPFGSALTKGIFVPRGKDTIKVYEQKNAIQKDASLGEYYITREYFENKMKGFELFAGDIIVSCAGTIGETFVMPDDMEQGIINQALMRMKLMPSVYTEYFLLYFDVILKQNARNSSKGSAIKNIPPFDILKSYLVPLPPLAEQKRIVAKIEELLPYCDQLIK